DLRAHVFRFAPFLTGFVGHKQIATAISFSSYTGGKDQHSPIGRNSSSPLIAFRVDYRRYRFWFLPLATFIFLADHNIFIKLLSGTLSTGINDGTFVGCQYWKILQLKTV